MSPLLSLALSFALMVGTAAETAAGLTVPLDQRLAESTRQGWGSLQEGKSVAGSPLTIHGRVFRQGLGTHAPSEIIYQANGAFQSFTAWVGVDDHLKDHPDGAKASVRFQVLGDGRLLFDSGVMRMVDDAKKVNVPLTGVQELKLLVNDAGDGIDCDHADWADAMLVRRKLTDDHGRTCEVIDKFSSASGCIRWDVEITGNGAPWSIPIQSWMEFNQPGQKRIWAAWGSPERTGTQLAAGQAALVQAGKASVSGVWSDPLVPTGFVNRDWHYGNVSQSVPAGSDYIALPLLSVLDPSRDRGLSIVLSPEDALLDVELSVSRSGEIRFSRSNHRLGEGVTRRFSLYLVPHEASWRGGLRFLTNEFPRYFNPPNPKADRLAGCGAYSAGEQAIDVAKFKRMAFGFNWKLSDDFPYMGMFLPPVSDPEETWERSCDEASAAYKGPLSSCGKMNDYARDMKQNGFAVLSYFNVTEFGKNMNGRKAVLPANAPDLWKDPVAFLQTKLPNAVFDPRIGTCYRARIVDPGDPDYLEFILEQAERHIRMLPDTEGICIDRTDWLRLYNPKADDGVTWLGNKPGRSLFRSWLSLMAKLGPQMHAADKVIFSNMMTMRLELCRELDGIYTEFGNHGNALNASALLGLRKPVVAWTYNQTLNEPDPDSFMQRHLYMGCFPTAPYPHNNHCIEPEPTAEKLYQDYGPLLNAMRGRKWVLDARAVETTTPGVKVNLFEVPDGFVLPVTFGGDHREAVVIPCKPAAGAQMRASAVLPGEDPPIPLVINAADGSITVPLHRGCAMIRLTRTQ